MNNTNKLKVLIVTENDPIYVYEFFKEFYRIFDYENIEISGVSILNAFNENIFKTGIRILNFYGLKDFIKLLFVFLKKKLLNENIKNITLKNKIKIIEVDSINSQNYISLIKKISPEIIISVAAPEIFKSKLLEIPKYCCMNIHSGEIPKYRGMMPTFWQMYENNKFITVTIHEMVNMLDAGGIIKTKKIPINASDNLNRLMIESKKESARLLANIIEEVRLTNKKPKTIPLDLTKERLFKFPTKKDMLRFKKIGHQLI